MAEWIFFDIGNVILNDDPAMAQLYRYIYQLFQENKLTVPYEDMLAFRETNILKNRNGRHHYSVAVKYLGEDIVKKKFKGILKRLAGEWEQVSPVISGIHEVIEDAAQHFKLGLIANQPNEVIPILEKEGVLKYFDVNAISAIAGFSKPDLRIFKYACEAAQCQPHQAVMIGDRIDNDIIPANVLGMTTIWLRIPMEEKGYQPKDSFETMYLDSIRRASASHLQPQQEAEQPHFVANNLQELTNALHKIRISGHGTK